MAARKTDAPWARSYTAFIKIGLFVVGIRLAFNLVLGSPIPGSHTLLTLPELPLPDWAKGIRIGGRVTAEGMLFALYDGARLATLLICVGAANALANPARLLKSLPGALYEAGVAVVVAMTFAPNMVADVVRLRTARRLRGRPTGGIRAIAQIGLPVLEGALERSVAVAASMDARGYGRTAQVPASVRLTTTVLTLGGLLGVCAGTYGLLASEGAGYGLPVLMRRPARLPRRAPPRRPPPDPYPLPPRPLGHQVLAGGRFRRGGRGTDALGGYVRSGSPHPRSRPADRAEPAAVARAVTARRSAPGVRRTRSTQGVPVIRFENVSVTYDSAEEPTVRGVELTIPEGELVLLVGPSGVGKSTLLGTVSGLVPHFTGGTLRGRVTVDGRDTRTHKPRELADLVGTVGQDPSPTSSPTPSRTNSLTEWSRWASPPP